MCLQVPCEIDKHRLVQVSFDVSRLKHGMPMFTNKQLVIAIEMDVDKELFPFFICFMHVFFTLIYRLFNDNDTHICMKYIHRTYERVYIRPHKILLETLSRWTKTPKFNERQRIFICFKVELLNEWNWLFTFLSFIYFGFL